MNVVVLDRFPPVRERLVSMIESIRGVEVVEHEENNQSVMEAVERLNPAVVVMDVCTGVIERLAKLRSTKTENEAPVFVVLADSPSVLYSEKLLSSGADFVFHRSCEFGKVVELIEKLSGGML